MTALINQENWPPRLLRRARVILDAANGLSNAEIADRNGLARQSVIALRQRFVERGIDAVLYDIRRSGRKPKIPQQIVEAIVEETINTRPRHAAHWTVRSMAAKFNVSPATVSRIWRTHHLQQRHVESFKFSTDPNFMAKVEDVVGLFLSPPRKALVLSADSRNLPEREIHDCWGNGTMTLLAALKALDGAVIGKCLPRHRNDEFIAFLETLEQTTPKHLDVHLIVDNYATHKHPNARDWIAVHPRYHVHFAPTGSTWMDFVGRFLAEITSQRILRPTFKSVEQLTTAIEGYIADQHRNPRKFVWRASFSCALKQDE